MNNTPDDQQQKYYESMNQRLEQQEKNDKLFNSILGGWLGCIGLCIVGIILVAILGSIWSALFG